MKEAGKALQVIHYPKQPHGFYWGRGGDPRAGKKCFEDMHAFFQKHLPTQPAALDQSLVKHVPVRRRSRNNRNR